MAGNNTAKFFRSNFELEYEGKILILEGYIGESGIARIDYNGRYSDDVRAASGKKVNVRFDKFKLKAVLRQQLDDKENFLELYFIELTKAQKEALIERIEEKGSLPTWNRKYPRIWVQGIDDPDLVTPVLAIVVDKKEEVFLTIVNFTLGGIRLEATEDTLDKLAVGDSVEFDLITSKGVMINKLSGIVRNIAVSKDAKISKRAYGIKLVKKDKLRDKQYSNLVKEYCVGLKRRLVKRKPKPV